MRARVEKRSVLGWNKSYVVSMDCAIMSLGLCMVQWVKNIIAWQFQLDHGQLISILSCTRIMKNNIFVGPKNETIRGLKLLLNQRTQWYDYIEEVMKITNVKPNKNSEYLASFNQPRSPFQIFDISLPQN